MCFDDCPEETQWVKSAAFLTRIPIRIPLLIEFFPTLFKKKIG